MDAPRPAKPRRRYYRVRLDHVEEGQVLVAVDDRGHRVEVRGMVDVDPTDPLQRVIDALPGGVVGGELFAGSTAHVDERSYPKALPVLDRLFDE